MRPLQTLEESNKYLISIADALYQLSSRFDIDKMDRTVLEKYSEDIFAISKALEEMGNNWIYKKEMEKKINGEYQTSEEK